MPRFHFALETTAPGTKARAARFRTAHGEVATPVFMPVGTQATVKSMTLDTLRAAGSSVLLANTYHLLLRPGPEVFRHFGGIHRFMRWDGPVLTDSGGFQIFSLPGARAMEEAGARFTSYTDGRVHLLSPESSIAMQKAIGSDIMMVLDQCIPSTAPFDEAEAAMHLTHRWARRSLEARGDSPQALFGIVQGACHADLRKRSAEFLRELPFDGLAIGGLAVGETGEERYRFTDLATDHLPADRPRYLMGVGTPIDILEAVHRGVDMFDCIIPGQVAQRGTAFTSHGRLQLRRGVYKFAEQKLDAACDCPACRDYSRAYLHHLVKTEEPLGWHLLTAHNLTFYHRLMAEMRASILRGDFAAYHAAKRLELMRDDEDHPGHAPAPPRRKSARRLGDYEVHASPRGFCSIRQISSGEIMHSVNPPEEEAERLYIGQSALAARLLRSPQDADDGEALVVWDVGLGAAHNAMAALAAFERRLSMWHAEKREADGGMTGDAEGQSSMWKAGKQEADGGMTGDSESPCSMWKTGKQETDGEMPRDSEGRGAARSARHADGVPGLRRLRLVSFERDLDPLRLATREASRFPHLRHRAPGALLRDGRWSHPSGLFDWELLEGDFLDTLDRAPAPNLIFHDPFSSKTDSPLWTPALFKRIAARAAPGGAELYTYSAATAVRLALLRAGWFVAEGAGTGPKTSTTIAFTRPDRVATHPAAPRLLGDEWLGRWSRSHAKFPADLPTEARAEFERELRAHPQFAPGMNA